MNLEFGPPSATLLDNDISGGMGGFNGFTSCSSGVDGPAIGGHLSDLTLYDRTSREYDATSPVQAGTAITVTFRTEPASGCFVLVSPQHSPLDFPLFQGVWLPLQNGPIFFMGNADSSGDLVVSVPLAPFPPGEQVQVYYTQPVLVDVVGGVLVGTLGEPGAVVIVL